MNRLAYGAFAILLIVAAWFGIQLIGSGINPPTAPGQTPGALNANDFNGGVLNPPQPVADFTLIDQYGEPYRLSDNFGDVIVLFFGYTTCPDVCPGTLAHFRQVRSMLGPDADDVQFLFVTVDPERDSTDRLREYVALFDPAIKGLTGDIDTLQQVWTDYGVYVERVEAPESSVGYWMNHTAGAYVINSRGELQLMHLYGMSAEDVVEDLKRLLQA